MRLIDADALWEYFRDKQCEITKYSRYHQLNDEDRADYDELDAVLEHIDEAPTIDAVPVVRCKDCKSFQADEIVAPGTGTCWHCEMVMEFDDFCSYGEPKDGDG